MPIWSSANIAGFPLDDFADQVKHKIDKEAVADRTKNGGAEVIGLKGATFYGIAMSVSNLVEAIIRVTAPFFRLLMCWMRSSENGLVWRFPSHVV